MFERIELLAMIHYKYLPMIAVLSKRNVIQNCFNALIFLSSGRVLDLCNRCYYHDRPEIC